MHAHPKKTNFRSGSKLQVSIHNLMKVVMLFNTAVQNVLTVQSKLVPKAVQILYTHKFYIMKTKYAH